MTQPILFVRYYQYLIERFHPVQFALLSGLIGGVLSIGASSFAASIPVPLTPVVASIALFLFFLRLRIFDEFKDHAHDVLHYPDRPLPRGLISKKELRSLLLLVWGGEIVCVSVGGYGVMITYGMALAYSLLMYKEFYFGVWLRERFTLYVASHEVLIIPLFCYIASFTLRTPEDLYSPALAALTLFSGAQLFLLEVARKVRAKEHEVASRDTYTAQYGVRGAGILIFFTAFFSMIGLVLFERVTSDAAGIPSLLGSMLLIAFIAPIRAFMSAPTAQNAKKLFTASVIFFSITHVMCILNAYLSL